MIIIVFGLPGAGKSYFSKALAKELYYKYISTDMLRKELVFNPTYSLEERSNVYSELLRQVNSREHVIIDGTFYRKQWRDAFKKRAKEVGAKIVFIEIVCKEEVCRKRLMSEREDSDANYEVYLKLKKEFEEETAAHLKLESNEPVDQMIQKAKTFISVNE